MSYPAVVPTSRSFAAGDFPVKAFKAQDGSETRFLYGNKRVGMSLRLSYSNVTDAVAQSFLAHYHQMFGTYEQFTLSAGTFKGWEAGTEWLDAPQWGSKWRYAKEPQVDSIYPGVSTVTVELVAATV